MNWYSTNLSADYVIRLERRIWLVKNVIGWSWLQGCVKKINEIVFVIKVFKKNELIEVLFVVNVDLRI